MLLNTAVQRCPFSHCQSKRPCAPRYSPDKHTPFLPNAKFLAYSIEYAALPAQCGHHVPPLLPFPRILAGAAIHSWPAAHRHLTGVFTFVISAARQAPPFARASASAISRVTFALPAQEGHQLRRLLTLPPDACHSCPRSHRHNNKSLARRYSDERHLPPFFLAISSSLQFLYAFFQPRTFGTKILL